MNPVLSKTLRMVALVALSGLSLLVSVSRADTTTTTTDVPNGFYSLQVEKVYDPAFDPTQAPKLTFWYHEAVKVGDRTYGIVPAATNAAGDFVRAKVFEAGELPPGVPFTSELAWAPPGKKNGAGPAEIELRGNDHLLHLYAKDKAHPLADFLLVSLGRDQAAAATTLGLDPKKFSSTMYLAHRGAARVAMINKRGIFPGNTIESMEHALLNGYPGFEIDIQMTKDLALVVSHDEKLGVSTDCNGNVSEHTLAEVLQCNVSYTGVVPDVKMFHNPALIPAKIPTLEAVLDRFLVDPRLAHVVLDVKPAAIDIQSAAFTKLLAKYPAESLAKIIFLMRSTDLIGEVQAGLQSNRDAKSREDAIQSTDVNGDPVPSDPGAATVAQMPTEAEVNQKLQATIAEVKSVANPLFTWEGSTGWETLEKAATSDNPNDYVFDQELGTDQIGLSLSLGLGLGLAGLNDSHRLGGITAAWQIAKSLPKFIARLFQNKFRNGSVDIDVLSWSKRNKSALRTLIVASEARGEKIVGWTVNTQSKISWLRENTPNMNFILSDLEYRKIVSLQLRELTTAL